MAFEDAVEGDEYTVIDKSYAAVIGTKVKFYKIMTGTSNVAIFSLPDGTPFALKDNQVEPVVVDPNKFKRVV